MVRLVSCAVWICVTWLSFLTGPSAAAADFAISPVEGAPPPFDERLARLVAEEMAYIDIPATTDFDGDHLFVLAGKATSKSDWTGTYTKIVWRVQDDAGNMLTELSIEDTAPFVSPETPWDALDLAALKRLAQKTAEAVESAQESLDQAVAAVSPTQERGTPGAAKPQRGRMTIGAISGAPGDGNDALALALAQVLRQYQVTVEAKPGPGIYSTKATVSVTNKDAQTQTVRIEWRLLGPAGQSYGKVEQENDVAAGSLTVWGDTAVYAAAGAGDGLVALMEQLGPTPPNVNE